MSDRPANRLDSLEKRLTDPKRIALFGHRNVGKTTLLAIFYRQASSGLVPGLRLAAADARTAEYLADKIAQIESGQAMAGSLAETELALRLYHGPARFDMIVKDYQGEHVTLGSEEPIQEFFADCDAVFLCLDPESSADPLEKRRRQQEVENLLERYIQRSSDMSAGRPVALLLTRFDRVLATAADAENPGNPDATPELTQAFVERVVNDRYGMTRHALAEHAPDAAVFAVSSFGEGAIGNRPPTELHPFGLDAPLSWLGEQLEAADRADMQAVCDLAGNDLPRFKRCMEAYEHRYPRSNRTYEFRARLKSAERGVRRKRRLRALAAAALLVAGLAGYDLLGFRRAVAFEREADRAAPSVARNWSDLIDWHPSLGLFFPGLARQARFKQAEWQVKSADLQVANGTQGSDLADRLGGLKDQAPQLLPAIKKVEEARELARHAERWKATQSQAGSLASIDDPATGLAAIDAFLREFPDTPHRKDALFMAQSLKATLDARRFALDKQFLDDLIRSESLPNISLADQAERARQFLAEHPDSPTRHDVERRLDDYLKRLDNADIEKARDFSRRYPDRFAARIEQYQNYLKAHQTGGRFLSEATEAKDQILRQWDTHSYRQAYDYQAAHPDDIAEVARRLRDYLAEQPDGRHVEPARKYLEWWDKASVTSDYHVTLKRGEVEPTVGKYFGGGGPDLGVVIEVAGVVYGPSAVIRDSRRPIWNYSFPKPIAWKTGDPITIRIIDYDWSPTEVFILKSREGDPLALNLLSGTIKPSRGGKTTLVFASDFQVPTLSTPE
jgi:hypothetical protein